MIKNIAIIGASGAIGNALINQLATQYTKATIHAFSRNKVDFKHANITSHALDFTKEIKLEEAANKAAKTAAFDLVLITTGTLHDGDIAPEKSLRDLSPEKFQHLFTSNTILPAMVAKYFVPKLNRESRSLCAALSARVGSISDNRLGGWYAYRASKAALNMIIKTTAIETARRNKNAIIIGLHPGTVDSDLSKSFQNNVPDGKLFTPAYSAQKLIEVINTREPHHSGRCFAWDGQEIAP